MAKVKERPSRSVPLPPFQPTPETKMFEGKRYQRHTIAVTKRGALSEVRKLRKAGYWARVLKYELYGYVIYKRRRPTYRRQAPVSRKTPRITPKTPKLR